MRSQRDRTAAKGRVSARRGAPSNGYVMQNGHVSHVLMPIEEYQRIRAEQLARETASVLRDPKAKWYTVEEVALRLAGSRIEKARKAAGLTQKALAQKMGVPQSQISRIESNPDRSTVRTIRRIAAALGVDVRSLI